ncbi:hypothetical protein GGP41_008242 [Bipolaris sorokiniana]|uniref:Uncharacterized protein n=1 Tax=Cochliobolus sativus TaxID=45130 RepID=A0A8H5ZPP4_COCSA|nr:hypothetical protein GGP41_008242 [Bipolaris sorokiniana]
MRDCELSEAQRMYAIAQFEGGSSTAKISNALNCRKARATVSRERYYSYGYRLDTYDFATTYNY